MDGFSQESPEKLIESKPRLRGMDSILTLLESEKFPDGETINWKDLHERVKPYHTMYELAENVREAVREYVALKIPKLKEAIPALEDLDEKAFLNALTHGWFEEFEEDEDASGVSGQRREILLTVAAHLVKRIETRAERKLLEGASLGQLAELGVDAPTRDLTVELLDVTSKADPLFIRFLAYSQLSGEPPTKATPTGLHLPGDRSLHTIAELFPHETQFLAKKLYEIAEKDSAWKAHPSAAIFVEYLDSLSRFYATTDLGEAAAIQKETKEKYAKLIETDFPVLITAATDGYYKEPYLDPELKVSIVTTETKK
jgi:hypothetical protein